MTIDTLIPDSSGLERSAAFVGQLRLIATMLDTALTTLRALAAADADEHTQDDRSDRSAFQCVGDMWSVTFAGRTCHLRDTRGLRYLAQLLRQPGREVYVTALFDQPPCGDVRRVGDTVLSASLGDAGVCLDAAATAQYQRRLGELRAALDEAESDNDLGRQSGLREELSFLTAELASAGRQRRVASHAERARVTVTKGIRTVLDRIDKAHPILGRHLKATIRTGYFCSYTPDPRVDWLV